jgi:hypothetical protein
LYVSIDRLYWFFKYTGFSFTVYILSRILVLGFRTGL